MNLIIRPQSQEEFQITMEQTQTLGDLLGEISARIGQDADNFRLVWRGRVLSSANAAITLQNLSIQSNDVIQVLMNIRPSRPTSETASSRPSAAFATPGAGSLTSLINSQILDLAIQDGEDGQVVHARVNGYEQEPASVQGLLQGMPQAISQLLGGLFNSARGQSEQRGPSEQRERQQTAQQHDANGNAGTDAAAAAADATADNGSAQAARPASRPQTRRYQRRERSLDAIRPAEQIAEPSQDEENVQRIQAIADQVMRERQTPQLVVSSCIRYVCSSLMSEADRLGERASSSEFRESIRALDRLQTRLHLMLCGGDQNFAQIMACLQAEGLEWRQQRAILERVLDYLP